MSTHSVSGYVLFILFVVLFVIAPTLIGMWWAGFRFRDIEQRKPAHIFTLIGLLFLGVIVVAVVVQSHVLSTNYTF